jgi:hypothetical protein
MQFSTDEELSLMMSLELDRASNDELTTIAEELSATTLELSGSTDEEMSVTTLSPELGSGLELESSPQATSPDAAIMAAQPSVRKRFFCFMPLFSVRAILSEAV